MGIHRNQRIAPRSRTEALITYRPFASGSAIQSSDGVMRNFSDGGFYIETSRGVSARTTLILRIIRFPATWPEAVPEHVPRTICLAEVRWQKEIPDEHTVRYGMGLKYLR